MTSAFDIAERFPLKTEPVPDQLQSNDMDYTVPEELHFLKAPKPWFGKDKWLKENKKAKDNFDRRVYNQPYDEVADAKNAFDASRGEEKRFDIDRTTVNKQKVREEVVGLLKKILGTSSSTNDDLNSVFKQAKIKVEKHLIATRNLGKITREKYKLYTNEISNMTKLSLYAVDRLLHILKENNRRQKTFFRFFLGGQKARKATARKATARKATARKATARINARASRRPKRSRFRRFGATQRSRR